MKYLQFERYFRLIYIVVHFSFIKKMGKLKTFVNSLRRKGKTVITAEC